MGRERERERSRRSPDATGPRREGPDVTVREGRPDVTVREGRPDLTVREDRPDLTVREDRPDLTVRERRDSTVRERRDSTVRERRDSTVRERRDEPEEDTDPSIDGAASDGPTTDGPTIPGLLDDDDPAVDRSRGVPTLFEDGDLDAWDKTQYVDIDRRLLDEGETSDEGEEPSRPWGEQTMRDLARRDTSAGEPPLADDRTSPDPRPAAEARDDDDVTVEEPALSAGGGQEAYDAKRALAEALLSFGGGDDDPAQQLPLADLSGERSSEELSLNDLSGVEEQRSREGPSASDRFELGDSVVDISGDVDISGLDEPSEELSFSDLSGVEVEEPSGVVQLDSAEVADLAVEYSGAADQRDDDDSIESWHGRIMQLEGRLLGERGQARVALLLEIGQIWNERLADPESASMFFERVLAEEPGHREAFEALARIYEVARSRAALIELLLNRVEQAGPEEQLRLFHRIAELYEAQGEPDKALVVLEAAANIAPDHRPTAEALERLEGAGPAPGTAETPRDPVLLLEQQLEQTQADDERIEIFEQLAALWQRRGDSERTIECLEQIIDLDRAQESAYGRLERIYDQAGEHRLLAETLVRHLAVAQASRRAELNRKLGQLQEGALDDPASALLAYRDALAADPDNRGTLQAVVRLSEQVEDWRGAARALRDLAELSSESQRVGYLARLGRLWAERLGDVERAEELYVDALAISPSHTEALDLLLAIYAERDDWGKVVRALAEADAHTGSVAQKSRFRFRAAMVTLEGLGDRSAALGLFEKTLALDPDHREAAERLAELYFLDERFDALEPVLELLLRRVDRNDTAKLKLLYQRLGHTSEALGKQQRASGFYHKALELDPKDVGTLRRIAEMSFAREDWSDALEHALRLLDVCRQGAGATGELDARDVSALLHTVAASAQQLGDLPQAVEALDDILALDARDRRALERLGEVRLAQGDKQAVLQLKQRQLELADDDEQRAQLLLEIGDLWSEGGRREEATQAYWKALEPRPQSHTVLHRLLDIYSKSGQWQQTVQLCDRLADAEQDTKRKAKYFHTAAVILRDSIGDAEGAIRYFNKALDADGEMLKAFEAIDKLCTERRDWKLLERAYGRMIQRLPQDGAKELKVTLWHNLGEVLRSRRRDFETAVAAFEAAQRLDPDNLERKQILAELYLSLGEARAPEALAIHHDLLRRWPQRMDLYHTLARLYMDIGQFDPAWCFCAALTFLRQADEQEQQYYQQYAVLAQASSRASDELWRRRIAHPDADACLGGIFGLLAPGAATLTARPHADFNLKRKARCDLTSDQAFVARMFTYVTSIFGLPAGDLHLRPDFDGGLMMAHTVEAPSFVAGAPVLEGGREKEVAFLVGKQLALLRPEYFLRNALATQSHLQVLLLAAVKLCRGDAFMLPPGQEAPVERMLAHLRKQQLHPAQIEQLGLLVREVKLERVDLAAWWRGVELTAERVGLIVCADPYVAAQMIGADCEGNETAAKERIAEMVRFAVSEDYFQVRRELGLAIG